jgi:putative ABC transport system substrate-binding protein
LWSRTTKQASNSSTDQGGGKREKLVTLAAQHSIPTIYGIREFAASGGLMSYGIDDAEQYRQIGIFAGKILKGAKPAELPVLHSNL